MGGRWEKAWEAPRKAGDWRLTWSEAEADLLNGELSLEAFVDMKP